MGWVFIENHITDTLKFCFTAEGLKIKSDCVLSWDIVFLKHIQTWSCTQDYVSVIVTFDSHSNLKKKL